MPKLQEKERIEVWRRWPVEANHESREEIPKLTSVVRSLVRVQPLKVALYSCNLTSLYLAFNQSTVGLSVTILARCPLQLALPDPSRKVVSQKCRLPSR